MKTAMQEFIDDLDNTLVKSIFERLEKDGLFKKALEKEKEQILDAHLNGQQDHHFSLESRMAESEDYYNQTYNQKQHIIDIMKADKDDDLYNQIN
jgi:hypothetical protein